MIWFHPTELNAFLTSRVTSARYFPSSKASLASSTADQVYLANNRRYQLLNIAVYRKSTREPFLMYPEGLLDVDSPIDLPGFRTNANFRNFPSARKGPSFRQSVNDAILYARC